MAPRLESHDPSWPTAYERYASSVESVAPDSLLGVFHIGSTAVPDLLAKPTVDVLAVFPPDEPLGERAEDFADAGYRVKRVDPDWVVLDRLDVNPDLVVHLRPRDVDVWRDQLVFRNLLRDDAGARRTYERAKREAAAAHPDDVHAYTDAKEPAIRSLVERAYDENYDETLPSLA